MPNFFKSDKNFIVFSIVYVIFLLLIPITLSPDWAKWMMSEEGPIEILSIVAWLVLAGQFAFSTFRPSVRWPMTLLFLGFGAREADLHKAFTTTGMLKLTYYTRSAAPIGEKLIAGAVALIFIGLLLYGCFLFFRFLTTKANWKTNTGHWVLLAGFLFFISKVLDRAPNVLREEHGVYLAHWVGVYCGTLEEGLELLVPLMLIWLAYAKKKSFTTFE